MILALMAISKYTVIKPEYQILYFVDFTKSMAWERDGYLPLKNFLKSYSNIAYSIFPGSYMVTYVIATSDMYPILFSEVKPYNKVNFIRGSMRYYRCSKFVDIGDSFATFKETKDKVYFKGYAVCWHSSEFLNKKFTYSQFVTQFRRGHDFGSPITKALEEACYRIGDDSFNRNIIVFYSDMIEEDRGNRIVSLDELANRINRVLKECPLSNKNVEVYIVEDVPVSNDRRRYKTAYQRKWIQVLRQNNIKARLISSMNLENKLINLYESLKRKFVK